MADFKVYKMNALPASPAANAVYIIKDGSEVVVYVTTSTGAAYPIKPLFSENSSNKFLATPPYPASGGPGFRSLQSGDLPSVPTTKLFKASPSAYISTDLLGSGSADSNTFLRGDGSWQPISAGEAGVYTPSASNTVNVQTFTGRASFYYKVGDYVFVNGGFMINPSSTGSLSLDISIPVPSLNTSSLIGFATKTELNGGRISEQINTNTGNDKAHMVTSMGLDTNIEFRFTFSYQT